MTTSVRSRALGAVRRRPALKSSLFALARTVGYDPTHWCRAVMYDSCFAQVEALGPAGLDVLEISGGATWRDRFAFRSYRSADFPAYDVCRDVLDEQFDLVIADQVFEHVRDPAAATRNVRAMLRPGGRFLVLTPFLILVHPAPLDCHRWTPDGLRFLLEDNGFADARISTECWGNRRAVVRNLRRFPRMGWGGKDMSNDPRYPVVVWAWAATRPDAVEPAAAPAPALATGRA